MYVGRLLVAAPGIAAYRVSSRSFPHRKIVRREEGTLTVVPTDEADPTDNPYVSYNCVRVADDDEHAVVGNGSHVDPVAEKLDLGYPPRDALAQALLTTDYEKDDYDTPRIAAVVGGRTAREFERTHVGVVRPDALHVEAVSESTIVATYETDTPEPIEFFARDPGAAARRAYDLDFEHPVCAAGVKVGPAGVETAIVNDRG